VGDGKVYIGLVSGDMHILAAGRQEKLLGMGHVDSAIYTSPVVANGVFYVTSQTQLVAVKTAAAGSRERQEPEGGTGNPEPGTGNPEPGTGNREPGTSSR